MEQAPAAPSQVQASAASPGTRAGPDPTPEQAKAFSAEKNTALLRVLVITFGVSLYWVAYYPRGIPWLAAAVSVVAFAYSLYDVLGEPYRRFPILAATLWTTVTDGVLITIWLHATGDLGSPFYLLWFVSLVAVTFRYDWRATVLAGALYSAAYTGLAAATGGLPGQWFDLVIRLGYLWLLAALGAILARESTRLFRERYDLGLQVKEADRFRALAAATPEAVLVQRDGIILEVNPAFTDLVGKKREDLLGKDALQLAAPQSRAELGARVVRPRDDPIEGWVETPHGRRLLRLQGRAIDWEGVPARVVAMRDITDERAAEEARSQALQSAMEVQRLRDMDRFKSDFINTAAHELNTPITPIKLQLHMLKRRVAPGAPERESIEILDRNMDRLAGLVEEMLDVARLQSGRLVLDPQPTDLSALLADAVATFKPAAADKGIVMEMPHAPALEANFDGKRISQVLYNLLSNALKFTPAGGRIEATLHADGADLVVAVKDTGLGLSGDEMARLFHPFVQLHRKRVTAAGTGLGLYISRGIAQRHGGDLSVSSPGVGQGATFTLRLPVAGPSLQDTNPDGPNAPL